MQKECWCGEPSRKRGLCARHYQSAYVRGELPDVPLLHRAKIQQVGVAVTPATYALLKEQAERRGVSVYKLAAEVLEGWVESQNLDQAGDPKSTTGG